MFDKTIETVLNDLIQIDIDATFAYKETIHVIDEKEIREQLISFQQDHERHIETLTALLRKIGGEPIKYTQDLKGYVIQGMTWLRSITGTLGALKAMVMNENITNKKYQDALEYSGFTQEVRTSISENYQDEKRHLEYIKNKVAELEKA